MVNEGDIEPEPVDQHDPRELLEEALAADHESYESFDAFALDLAVAMKRALEETDDDVIDTENVATTLARWNAILTGRVVLPVTKQPSEARRILYSVDTARPGTSRIAVPITEGMLHDIDNQLTLIDAVQETGDCDD